MAEQESKRRISRRDFLKLLTAGAAGSFLAGCAGPPGPDEAVPYYQDPPAGAAGESVWYATVCRMCPAGCGIRVRTVEGRAKKIEGNPEHPISQGRLCALGQAGLQHLYNPDRITRPFRRLGSKIQPVQWDEGISLVADAIRKANARGPGRVAIWTGPVRGTRRVAVEAFAQASGARHATFSPFAPGPERAAHRQFYGSTFLPTYELAEADFVLCLGADYLERWLSPVYYGVAYGKFRQGRENARGYLIHVSPRLSMTAANADEWIPVRPGTEGALALAIANVLLSEGLARRPQAVAEQALDHYSPEWAAQITGVPTETIIRIARLMGRAQHPLVLAGGPAAAHTNGTQNILAGLLLNELTGQRTWRLTLSYADTMLDLFYWRPRRYALAEAQQLVTDMRMGSIEVLLVLDSNPVFELPRSLGFVAAADKVGLIASLPSFPDETAAISDVVLPDHTYLERWAVDAPDPQPRTMTLSMQQPVTTPLYDTWSAERALAQTALNVDPSAPTRINLRDDKELALDVVSGFAGALLSAFWAEVSGAGARGFWSREPHAPAPPVKGCPPGWIEPRFQPEGGLHLLPYPTVAFWDGSGANLPWMQEFADPMTSIVWDSWAEMHPQTARKLGIRDGEVAVLSTPWGEMRVAVVLHEGLHPDVVAVPVGQGYTAYGRYARGTGANPLALLAPLADEQSGALAWAATKVQVKRTGKKADLVRMAHRPKPLPGSEVIRIAKGPKPL